MNFTATTFPSSSLRSLLIPRWLSDFGSSVTPLSPSHASAVRQGFITGRKDAGGVRSHRPNILTFILLAIPLLLLCRNVLSSNIGVIMILQFLGLSLSLSLSYFHTLSVSLSLSHGPTFKKTWGTQMGNSSLISDRDFADFLSPFPAIQQSLLSQQGKRF